MRATMALGDFLVAYLRKIGVEHLFGIPGDLVLRLFSRLGRPRGLKIVTLAHEPGVGFAADGYARATGRIGVVCVTYGAGGHNMVNPVAGSCSARGPVLAVSGGAGGWGVGGRRRRGGGGHGGRTRGRGAQADPGAAAARSRGREGSERRLGTL